MHSPDMNEISHTMHKEEEKNALNMSMDDIEEESEGSGIIKDIKATQRNKKKGNSEKGKDPDDRASVELSSKRGDSQALLSYVYSFLYLFGSLIEHN